MRFHSVPFNDDDNDPDKDDEGYEDDDDEKKEDDEDDKDNDEIVSLEKGSISCYLIETIFTIPI